MGRKSIRNIRCKEIIEVFYEVAVNEGLENTSIAKIASEMDCNPSLIIHYFNSKEELINGLIDHILEKYLELFSTNEEEIKSKDAFLEILGRMFSRAWNNLIDDGVFYSCYALTFTNEKVRKKFRELHQQLRVRLTELLKSGIEKGYLNAQNLEEKAELFFVILEGAYYYTSLLEEPEEGKAKMNDYKMYAFSLFNFTPATADNTH